LPFDTTYYLQEKGSQQFLSVTVPGGKDTTIMMQPGEKIPADLRNPDSLIANIYKTIKEQPTQPAETDNSAAIFISIMLVFLFLRLWKERRKNLQDAAQAAKTKIEQSPYLTYYGDSLNFSDEEIRDILEKHFIYFTRLSQLEKKRFLARTQVFIADKIFKIHCNPGFKEMPVLISAAAVQLTFGLKKYLLPHFKFIHVYPQEFTGIHPTFRVLEGNVSGHAINLSWKHFLAGYQNPANGQNTGLHELAHALYYQTFVVEENADSNFRDTFDSFTEYGNKVYEEEHKPGNDLYSDYALKNFQEFWAESMEIFFEKPWQLKMAYPTLYSSLVLLLNQDPTITTPEH
jgi:MtfA peptidase